MLQTLKLFKLTHWPDPPPFIPATVRHLELMACPGLFSLDHFKHLKRLEVLRLGLCPDLIYVSVRRFVHLQELSLVDIAVRKLDDLACAPQLREAYLAGLADLVRIGAAGGPQEALRKLRICRCPQLEDISGVAGFVGLDRLILEQLPALSDVGALAELRSVSEIVIDDCPALASIAPILQIPSLRKLTVTRCPNVADSDLLMHRADLVAEVSP